MVPLAIVLIYREVVSRQFRQKELELRLQAEHELGKARDEFVANTSHELRTPLTSIIGLGQMVEMDPELSEDTREIARDDEFERDALGGGRDLCRDGVGRSPPRDTGPT